MGNYMFGKIIAGGNAIEIAPSLIYEDGFTKIGFTEDDQNRRGYHRIITSDYPTDGSSYVEHYEQVDNQIIQSWVLS